MFGKLTYCEMRQLLEKLHPGEADLNFEEMFAAHNPSIYYARDFMSQTICVLSSLRVTIARSRDRHGRPANLAHASRHCVAIRTWYDHGI